MEPASKMASGPPRIVETATALLLPPAQRESVLGDLRERFLSTRRYCIDAIGVAPHVIFSQVRRSTDVPSAMTEILLVYSAFLCASWWQGVSEPAAFCIPALAAGVVLRFRDAWLDPALRTPAGVIKESIFAAGCGAGALMLAASLPLRMVITGALLAVILVSGIRMPWRRGEIPAPASGPGDLQQQAADFHRRIRRRNLREYAAAAFVMVVFSIYIWKLQPLLMRIGSGLIVLAAAYVVCHLHRWGSAAEPPAGLVLAELIDFHRRQLARQRNLLGTVWLWYLGPFVPGFLLFAAGSFQAGGGRPADVPHTIPLVLLATGVFALVVSVNRRGARRLQQQIDRLESIKAKP